MLPDPFAIGSIRYPILTLSDQFAIRSICYPIHTLSAPYAIGSIRYLIHASIQSIRYLIHMLSVPYAIRSICYPIHTLSDPYAIRSIRYPIHTLSDPYAIWSIRYKMAEVPINLSRKTIEECHLRSKWYLYKFYIVLEKQKFLSHFEDFLSFFQFSKLIFPGKLRKWREKIFETISQAVDMLQ